jgi:Uma2 family endonuclease
MSSLATALVTFDDFVNLPDPDNARRYELHDGEVVLVPPARPIHVATQMTVVDLLRAVEQFGFIVSNEYPYRPAANYQFWYADVAVLPASIRAEMSTWEQYKPYSPDLIIEVLSPSNTKTKIAKQRIASMSHGTREFWVIDADERTVHVTSANGNIRLFHPGDSVDVLGVIPIDISAIFVIR